MARFLSCDWGTSTFRLVLVDADSLTVLASVSSDQGIADTYRRWREQSSLAVDRTVFYASVLKEHLGKLRNRIGEVLDDVPMLISGMAASSVGLIELPYALLPFSLDGDGLIMERLQIDSLSNPVLLISGARTDVDVMRGEETKVLGASAYLNGANRSSLLILPGTHSKHVTVSSRRVMDIRTYMTGELFGLLSRQSLLATSVAASAVFSEPEAAKWFSEGVTAGTTYGVLHGAFLVRTNDVLKHVPPSWNYYFLSGLLIGAELSTLHVEQAVYLVAGPTHARLYQHALQQLNIPVCGVLDADETLIRGQRSLFLSVFPNFG